MYMLVSKQYFSVELEVKTTSGSGSKAAAAARRMVRNCSGVLDASIGGEYRENVRVQRGYRSDGSRSDAASHHDVAEMRVHECTMLLALRSTFHVYLVTKTPACATQRGLVGHASIRIFSHGGVRCHGSRSSAKDCGELSVTQNPSRSTCRLQVENTATAASPEVEGPAAFLLQYHDSYVLLGSLCKMC
jgi:hypothetical protein